MSTFDPNNPFPNERPRSSPIPGVTESDPVVPPSPPPGAFGQAPYGQPGATWTPAVTVPTRSSRSGWLVLLLVLVPLLVTVGLGAFIAMQVRGAVDDVTDQFDGTLSGSESDSLGLDVDASSLFEPAATQAVVDTLEANLDGDPTQVTQVIIYPEYAIVTAQDPAARRHIDQYIWRGGNINGPIAQPNDDQLRSKLFTMDQVDWEAIGGLAQTAPTLVDVEDGEVTHIYASKDGFSDGAVVVRIYVSGPRDSAYIEATPQGEVVATY